jgi:DNA-directed RNA polymerase specialized sigma24 family protein
MPRTATRKGDSVEPDEVARLLALWIKLQLGNQAAAIVELGRAGFGPTRIAELLGTTVGTVNVTLQRSRKRAKGKPVKLGEETAGDD